MSSRILIIYEYQILFEILDEIHESLNFKIVKSEKKDYKKIKFDPKINYLIVTKKKIENLNNDLVLENIPLKLDKLLEIINTGLKIFSQNHLNQEKS